MDFLARSDLACEYFGASDGADMGIEIRERRIGSITLGETHIKTQREAERLQKPQGTYLTFSFDRVYLMGESDQKTLTHLLAGRLRGMVGCLTGKPVDAHMNLLVVGLGNPKLTPDALGPLTASRLRATRHLREYEPALFAQLDCCAMSVFTPDVLGETGLEALDLIRGAVAAARPDAVIAVDALAAHSCERLAATVQLSNTGITPGSGVGNHRGALTAETLGVPVLSLGAPTVVNSAVLIRDALGQAGMCRLPSGLEAVLESGKSFFVSPKECDTIVDQLGEILSNAISLAFSGNLL